jgi:hypothetical protein
VGSKDHYAADRAAADHSQQALPDLPLIALSVRAFLAEAVRRLAVDYGIRQFTQQPAGKVVWSEIEDERPERGVIDRSAGPSCSPRRIPGAGQTRPAVVRHDPDVLRRLRDGLRDLDLF